MRHIKTETHNLAVDTAPLFASVWIALFNELRKNYMEPTGDDLDVDAGSTNDPETSGEN